MRKLWTLFTGTLLIASLTGCNQMGQNAQDADAAYAQIRDRFQEQQAFSFYGRTKLLTGDTANGNVVNFSGQKQGDDLLMNVKLSFPERKRVDSMSILAKGQKLYARSGDRQGWRIVDGRDGSLRQELNNWNPSFNFQQMNEMKASVVTEVDRNPEDNLQAVRVLFDSTKLKNWLSQQMKEQTGTQIQTVHSPRLKLAMTLSDGDWKNRRPGMTVQATEPNIDQIIDQMELEAECSIYYDQTTMLPTSTVMSIRSQYDLNNQRVQEHSQVETFLQDYGQVRPLPDPMSNRP
ncbi:hypothetical protein [Brevibacillus sp. H7]|uniref:hypothetical protein n=1 Tax=Brevibacillus sp. H7 TaxID=3349138 RepID=UPI0038037846